MKNVTINLTFNTDGNITDFDIVADIYDRTEYCMDGVDEPMTVQEVIQSIKEYLTGR